MAHQLSIDDELWNLYEGSGMAMRDALWREKVARVAPTPNPPAVSASNGEGPWGTLFISRKLTGCPLCRTPIPPRMEAVMTSWTKPGKPVGKGPSGTVHVECAERNGIEIRWSVDRMLGDLRHSIATIQTRRLRRRR